MFDWFRNAWRSLFAPPALPAVLSSDLPPYVHQSAWHGEKFPGGLGAVDLLITDYWALRARSAELFKKNLYARGVIRRMVTNEINVGLHLECTPEERILGLKEDTLADWTEDVENRFALWEKDPWLCDHTEQLTFGGLQQMARLEALVSGDVLVVLRQFAPTGLPRIQLINGASVRDPWGKQNLKAGNRIVHGVELDAQGRQVAYWVQQPDGTSKRLAAWGEKSGRKLAWLLYGTDKRLDDVRGEPILSLILQSLKEVDRYRDSIQRKALVLSLLAMFIEKSAEGPSTRPLSTAGGALRKDQLVGQADDTGKRRVFKAAEMIPGMAVEQLEAGEKPVAFQHQGAYEKFGEFEEAIIQAIAWSMGIPPEILRLAFSNNYSASQAAINEYKMLLNMLRTTFGEQFCQPIYIEWIVAATLSGKVKAARLLESWRDSSLYDVFAAWTNSDWAGAIKPAVDLSRLVSGYKEMVEEGFISRDRATRELTGTKYSKNVQKLARENPALATAKKELVALDKPPLALPSDNTSASDEMEVELAQSLDLHVVA